jgi:hypothetical protein
MGAAPQYWNLPLVPTSPVYQVSWEQSNIVAATYLPRFP